MGRSFLILMVFMGLFAAMMSNCSSRPGATRSAGHVVPATDDAADSGASRKRSGASSVSSDGSSVEIERSSDGHFYADVQINGAPVHMLVDTGATGIALSRDDAHSAGVATSIGMND